MATAEQTFEHLRAAGLDDLDPDVAGLIDRELGRQRDQLELIASENFTWPAVLEAASSVLTNKYAEGYPGKRYYGGCEWVDEIEQLAIDRAKALFGADHANVQPHAGGPANLAAYFAMLEPGDPILGLRLDHGGHLTHGLKVNFSGRLYDVHSYGVRREDSRIDFDEVERLAHQHRPRLIVAGASAYPRVIDAARFREIADDVGARLMVDMAHFSGPRRGRSSSQPGRVRRRRHVDDAQDARRAEGGARAVPRGARVRGRQGRVPRAPGRPAVPHRGREGGVLQAGPRPTRSATTRAASSRTPRRWRRR